MILEKLDSSFAPGIVSNAADDIRLGAQCTAVTRKIRGRASELLTLWKDVPQDLANAGYLE
jgi:hypothetical protein